MRVLIVEDSGFMAHALAGLLNDLPAFTNVGHAICRVEALDRVIALQPDLVILDLRIRDTPTGSPGSEHGLATLQAIRCLVPATQVLVFSSLPEHTWLRAVARAGAVGFVNKDSSTEAIIAALQAIATGTVAFTPAQLSQLQQPAINLSPRELETLALLAEGLSNDDIARRLGISVGTARKHVEHLCTAFGVSSRGQVVAIARREGLLLID